MLEIGPGSGYQIALLAVLARRVYSLERIAELAQQAIPRMRQLGLDNVKIQVFDGTVGQNALQQGRLFAQAVTPTGIIVTKLDGSARGGAVTALRRELGLPIRFLGVGEQLDDLQPFDPERFAQHLLAESA